MKYDTLVSIDIDALENNINNIKKIIAPSRIQAVLKADAYGHLAKEIFKYLLEFGIDNFAVANLIEALELRRINEQTDIMVFGRINKENLLIALKNNITITIYSKESAEDLIEVLNENPKYISNIHLKINTGFNRLGFDTTIDSLNMIKKLFDNNKIKIKGIFSHLALVDENEDKIQFNRFTDFVSLLENKGINVGIKHIADSIGAVKYSWARLDMVRLGAVMYGLKSDDKNYELFGLKGTMRMTASISQIREIKKNAGISYDYLFKAKEDMRIATVSVGYADGIPRYLSDRGYFVVNSTRCPIVGLMCMDQCMIDISNAKNVNVGDEVLIFDIDANSELNIGDLAKMACTNKNEIIASIGKRVTRKFKYKNNNYTVNQLLD